MAEKKERIQFDFSVDALQRLDTIKQITGATSKAEVVREALKFYEWLVTEVNEGNTVKVFNESNEAVAVFKAKLLFK